MRVVVTGAAGFIGSHLCRRPLAQGREVTGIDAFTRFYPRALKQPNLAGLLGAPGFAVAGRPGVRGGAAQIFEAGNVQTTEQVLRVAAAAGVPRVVLASSSSVYGELDGPAHETLEPRPVSLYDRSKLRAERVATRLGEGLGVDVVGLRYSTVYGPRQRPYMAFARFIAAALVGEPMALLGDGRQHRDFTYVDDVCEATLLAVERGRRGVAYNLAGGRSASLAEALGHLTAAPGRRPELHSTAADTRDPRSTEADLRRARTELGYEPKVGLAEGIGHQVRACSGRLAGAAGF